MSNVSQLQIQANRRNSLKSRGAVTEAGKQAASKNAISHGLFATSTVLPHEDEQEYNQLLENLTDELNPVGILEYHIVEKIVQIMWKQHKRLTLAQNSANELNLSNANILHEVIEHTGNKFLSISDIEHLEPEDTDRYKNILQEIALLPQTEDLSIILLDQYPALRYKLIADANKAQLSLKNFIEQLDVSKYITELLLQVVQLKKKNDMKTEVKRAVKLVKNSHFVNISKLGDKLNKYEVMLNNQLYKAIKELKSLQKWRYSNESITENGFVLENQG